MADLGSDGFKIYGRNTNSGSSGGTPWNDDDFPLMTHWDGGRWNDVSMGQGDSVELLLVYDPDRTSTIDGFTTKYTARRINRQD